MPTSAKREGRLLVRDHAHLLGGGGGGGHCSLFAVDGEARVEDDERQKKRERKLETVKFFPFCFYQVLVVVVIKILSCVQCFWISPPLTLAEKEVFL